jgi:hypothetical protein
MPGSIDHGEVSLLFADNERSLQTALIEIFDYDTGVFDGRRHVRIHFDERRGLRLYGRRRIAGTRRDSLSVKIQIEVPDELFAQLMQVAEAMGISSAEEVATVGLAEWTSRRKSELDDRNPKERYMVNEALDELLEKKK